ncbi:glutaredoxin family protein [Patescibacteria group bacterium]|nr:glutaredoxin family protein [Patescibacteria group bacterium]
MKITIYTTAGCVYCKMAKEFFKRNKISYEEKDISDDNARREMIEKSNQLGVPVIDIDGQIIAGFDEDVVKKLLKL